MLAKLGVIIIIFLVLLVLFLALVYAPLWVSARDDRTEERQGRRG